MGCPVLLDLCRRAGYDLIVAIDSCPQLLDRRSRLRPEQWTAYVCASVWGTDAIGQFRSLRVLLEPV